MTWIIGDTEEEEFVSQLAGLPDRIVGLLAPAIVEKRIEAVIKARWADTPKGDLLKDLFRDGGPLGSFATRIQVGFAIRIYGQEAYDDLRDINKIRNAFAHQLKAKDFDYQAIRDRANRLRLPDKFPAVREIPISTPDDAGLFELILDMAKQSLVGELVDARSRFVRTIEILAILLWAEEHFSKHPDSDALPPMPRF